jgi:amidase
MTSVLSAKPWLSDPVCLPIPWRVEEESLPQVLCFGFATGDGHSSPTPPNARAMSILRSALTSAGHICIDFDPVEMPAARGVIDKFFSADGGAEFRADLLASREPMPAWLADPKKRPAQSVSETWENQAERDRIAERWGDRWNGTEMVTGTGRPMDCLISPGMHFPAIRHGQAKGSGYAAIGALLDLTCGVVPVTRVCLEKDVVPEDWEPKLEGDEETIELCKSQRSLFGSGSIGCSC